MRWVVIFFFVAVASMLSFYLGHETVDAQHPNDEPSESLTLCQAHCIEKQQCTDFLWFDKWRGSECYQCRALCRIEGLLILMDMEDENE